MQTEAPQVDFALIGGTGIGWRLAERPGHAIAIPTRFGLARGKIITGNTGANILAIQRHAAGHRNPPHRVNYLAIAESARILGARFCISSAAVGCLRSEWPVGTLALCTDMLELSGRSATRFDRMVEHTDMTRPFPLSSDLADLAAQVGLKVESPAVYATMNGPRYESPAEIRMLKTLGADVVGMTASTEAVAMREAGVPYGCIAIVTNAAAMLSEGELSHGEVVDAMESAGPACVSLMLATERWVSL